MIVVIEGADGTGKTTLAKRFVERGFRYVHNGVPTPGIDMFEEYTEQLLEAQGSGDDVVFDRLHLGELVYGTYVRKKPGLTFEHLHLLNRLLFSRGGVLIICHTLDQIVVANWQKRHEREYVTTPETVVAINHAYGSLYREMRSPNVSCYDYDHYSPTDDTTLCDLFAGTCPDGVIGSTAAKFLFIGEQPGNGPHDLAFHSMERSSGFLNHALWEAGYLEREMAFTNARTKKGRPRNLREVYAAYDEVITVIALGRVAQRACLSQGVPFLSLAHPQYVKRFKSARRDAYVGQLRLWRK